MRQKGPTMADIAKLSGVSQSTVSLVLNQKGGSAIPPETVERVQAAARKLHYVKAPRSRTAPARRSTTRTSSRLSSKCSSEKRGVDSR